MKIDKTAVRQVDVLVTVTVQANKQEASKSLLKRLAHFAAMTQERFLEKQEASGVWTLSVAGKMEVNTTHSNADVYASLARLVAEDADYGCLRLDDKERLMVVRVTEAPGWKPA